VKLIIKTFLLLILGLGIMVGCSPVSFDVDEKAICDGLSEEECNPITPSLAEFTTTYSVPRPKVDVIIMNDNSGTMLYEQQEMGLRFGSFTNELTGLDWQLGITTMDISNANRLANGEQQIPGTANANLQDGKLVPFSDGSSVIREGQANVATLFSDAITIETKGLHDERGILAASLALQGSAVRSDSTHVALIMLTDEDVRSGGEANNSNPAVSGTYSVMARDRKEHLLSVWNQVSGGRKTISVHSLIVKPNDSSCLTTQRNQVQPNGLVYNDANYGLMYNDLSNDIRFKGIVGNICSSNYTNELRTMGDYIAGRTEGDIPLNKTCEIITNDINHPITITLSNSSGSYTFKLGFDPLPMGLTSVQAFPGRVQFTPGLNAGTNVSINFSCRL
jgi:hypothetical protein